MKRKLLVIVLCFGLLLTGCQMTKSYSIEEITEGGEN